MDIQTSSENFKEKPKTEFKDSKYATGRRKRSIARVWLKKGNGNIIINGKKIVDYFINENLQIAVYRPLKVVKSENLYDIRANVKGGGLSGQAGAIRHGISKALSLYDPSLRPALKKVGYITRDSRVVERKKPGLAKARRSYQFSKR